ncbi:hypothetical protein V5E97_35405 [Singulisphaera sp. Ch08]|uniref:DUF11 domain-containing protein n=1 Tax=Singulisphaera sp. Ch08 TaxID=3120278 RepID=A0AAU7CEI8_9BACT
MLEPLEGRDLLSVVSTLGQDGVLAIVSDSTDAVVVQCVDGLVKVDGDDPDSGAAACEEITAITITGGPEPDANLIDLRGVVPAHFPSLASLQVDGGGGRDRLIGPDLPALWILTAPDEGSLAGPALGPFATYTFTSVEDLVGGAGADTFVFGAGTSLSGVLDGGGGGDALDFGDVGDPLDVQLSGSDALGFHGTATGIGGGFEHIAILIGGTSTDRLMGEGAASTWSLDGTPSYSDGAGTLRFAGFETLQGGRGDDTFHLIGDSLGNLAAEVAGGEGDDRFLFRGIAILTGSIDGEGGRDTLDYDGFASSVAVVLTASDASGHAGAEDSSISGGGFRGVDTFVGSGLNSGPDILRGRDTPSRWTLGAISTYADGPSSSLNFSAFESLRGGSAEDRFEIASDTAASLSGGGGDDAFTFAADGVTLHGAIDGQGGRDRIDQAAFRNPTRIDMSAGTATGVPGGIRGVEDATGGDGDDTLIGDPLANALDGGPGNDRLFGGGGNDRLLGGDGSDDYVLSPGDGSRDVLIDTLGDDTLDFSTAGAGITLDLDSEAVQAVTPGGTVQLVGDFENVVGSRFTDTIALAASPGPRRVDGGPPGTRPGDTLRFDARGQAVTLTPTTITSEGFATVAYTAFEQVELINAAGTVPNSSDLSLSQSAAPDFARAGEGVAISITVTNLGPSIATRVTVVDTLPDDVSLASATASQGDCRVVGSTLICDLGSVPIGASATVTLILVPRSAGTLSNTARVRANEPDPGPVNNETTLTLTVTSATPSPPLVVEGFRRSGIHRQPTRLVLTFNQPLQPATAVDVSNYRLVGLGRDRRFGTRNDRHIAMRSVKLDPTGRVVTLTPIVRLPIRLRFQLTVAGAESVGLTSTSGRLLDGDSDGRPGGSFITRFGGWVRWLPGWMRTQLITE